MYKIRLKSKVIQPLKNFFIAFAGGCSLIMNMVPTINPFSRFYWFWEMGVSFFTFFLLFKIPYYYSFRAYLEQNLTNQREFYYLCLVLYVADILVQSNTKIFNKGQLISNHWEIFKNYTKGRMVPDLITTLIFILFVFNP